MNEATIVMDNPLNEKEFRKWILATLVVFIFGVMYALFTIERWNAISTILVMLGLILGSSVPFYIGWHAEYIRRPFRVEVREDGVVCHFRYNRKIRFVPWDQVISISAHPVPMDPAKRTKYYWLQDSSLWFKNPRKRKKKEQYILHRPIAIAAREQYREKMGQYPPMLYWELTNTVQYA